MSPKKNNSALGLLIIAGVVMLMFATERDRLSRTIVSFAWVPLLMASGVFLRVVYNGWEVIYTSGGRRPFTAVAMLAIPVVNVYGVWKCVGGYPSEFNRYLNDRQAPSTASRLGSVPFWCLAALTTCVPLMIWVGTWLGDFRFSLRPLAELLLLSGAVLAVVWLILTFVVVARICRAVATARDVQRVATENPAK